MNVSFELGTDYNFDQPMVSENHGRAVNRILVVISGRKGIGTIKYAIGIIFEFEIGCDKTLIIRRPKESQSTA